MERQGNDRMFGFFILIFVVGFLSLAASKVGENIWSFPIAGFALFGMISVFCLLANGKIKNPKVIFFLGILFFSPMYLFLFAIMPIPSKIIVLNDKIVDSLSWKIPFVDKVVEVNKNVFAQYDCFAVREKPNSFIKGHFGTYCEVQVLDKERFLEFVASEKDPNGKIKEKANIFLAILVRDSELSTEVPFPITKENFHDH